MHHRQHFKEQSPIPAHCLRLQLSSLADPRLNEPCTHDHPDPMARPDMPRTDPRTSVQCSDAQCKKRSRSHCQHCTVSFCRTHLETNLCTSECLPPADVMGDKFVCRRCQPLRDSYRHTESGCATCDEVEFFKEDLLVCAHRTKCPDLLGRAKCICESIDIIVGHNARIVNQERFWPALMEEMRENKRYDHVALKSDYWKKFEGTALKVGLCTSHPKQSVETHSAWYLLPPKDTVGVNWDLFPEGHDLVEPDADGFRGFVVEFINVISDVVVQDGYQSVLNLRTVLNLISTRHPRVKTCSRETDGAASYNSIFVALMTLQLGKGGKSGTIKVTQHCHNEPGHGADICDTAGANCIRCCWRKTKRTGLSIICAARTTTALREAKMRGFIHLQVNHSHNVLPCVCAGVWITLTL